MQIGVITIDDKIIGIISMLFGDDDDNFIPDLDGYRPEGRATEAPHGIVAAPESHPYPYEPGGAEPERSAPKVAPGRPVAQGSSEVNQAIEDAARAHHLSPAFMKSVASIESGMNPNSNAGRPTQYKGLYQIGSDEWRRFGEGNIYSAHDNAFAAARMFEANRDAFRKRFGRDPTDTEMYLMHQQGLGFYTNGTMTNIAGNLPPAARTAENMTHEGFEAYWGHEVARREQQFENTEPSTVSAAPGQEGNALDWMRQREGLNEVADREKLKADMGGFDPETEAWCARFVNSALKSAGIKGSGSDVANSFQHWGNPVLPGNIKAGDVALMTRGRGPDETGGHVGMFTGQTRIHDGIPQFEMEAGNTADSVRRSWHALEDPSIQFRRAPVAAQVAQK